MAWTQSDLDALSAALVRGVKSVTFADGRSTVYQNTAEMLAVRNQIRAELNLVALQTQPRVRSVVGRVRRSC